MHHRRLFLVLLLILWLTGCLHAPAPAPDPRPPVILVSIDGFRADYLKRGLTPNLARLAEQGAWATEGMKPSFPSLTYPNHYSLVTGRRPDRNGLVANSMEDPAIPGGFSLGQRSTVRDPRWWNQAEPIWNTAERAGVRTAPDFWPGSEAPIHGMRPSRWLVFDQAMPSAARVDRLLSLFEEPEGQQPGFATLYFDRVDTQGHRFGPESRELEAALAEVDGAVGRLLDGLKAHGLERRVNLIVVADHGMAELKPELRRIADDWVPPEVARLVSSGSTAGFAPMAGRDQEAEARLLAPHTGARCWRKGELPERFHYGRNPRVPPIVCMADLGGYIVSRRSESDRSGAPDHGAHGYDPEAVEMRALFLASGPAFAPGSRLPPFDNVSVYPLLAYLLGVKPEAGDGKLVDLQPALRP